jgi:hypothetical protein
MGCEQSPHQLQLGRANGPTLYDESLFHALTLHTSSGRVQRKRKLFFAGLPASNLSSSLPVNRINVNNDEKVSDLRQSRRLDGAGAAQSRMALRAVVPRSPCHKHVMCSSTPCLSSAPRDADITKPSRMPQGGRTACALGGRGLPALVLQDVKRPLPLPEDIPGTVKLWESPRQSRGVSHWTKQRIL